MVQKRQSITINHIKADVRQIVADELQRIQNNPALAHLIQQKG